MSSILYRINGVLSRVVASVPIGTNLGLFPLLWMLLSGRLLQSRGAVIPGLADLGLAADAVRRCWAALAYGTWQVSQLLGAWEQLVREEGCFQAHQHGGYRPVACDLVGFFRPRLQDCPTKHYSSAAGKPSRMKHAWHWPRSCGTCVGASSRSPAISLWRTSRLLQNWNARMRVLCTASAILSGSW